MCALSSRLRPLRYRRATGLSRVPVCLLLCVVAGNPLAARETALPDAAFERWEGHLLQTQLADDSTLAEFRGETVSLEPSGYRLRVSFLPRFGCVPLVSVRADLRPGSVEKGGRSAAGLAVQEFRIDDQLVDLPAIIDDDGQHGTLYFQTPRSRAFELRQRIDTGNVVLLLTEADERVDFSLFGSNRTLQAVQARCMQHPPEPEASTPANKP